MTTSSAFVVGDVVEVEFPYAYPDGEKKRPALVIAGPNVHSDYTLIMISSREQDDGVPIGLADFASGSLKAASFARVQRLYTLNGDNVLVHRGRLKLAAVDRVRAKLCPALGCRS